MTILVLFSLAALAGCSVNAYLPKDARLLAAHVPAQGTIELPAGTRALYFVQHTFLSLALVHVPYKSPTTQPRTVWLPKELEFFCNMIDEDQPVDVYRVSVDVETKQDDDE